MSLEGTIFWLVALAIEVPLSPAEAMLTAGVTILVTAIPSAPGYVGTYELAATAVATSFGRAGRRRIRPGRRGPRSDTCAVGHRRRDSLASLGGGLRRDAAGAIELERAEEREAAAGRRASRKTRGRAWVEADRWCANARTKMLIPVF